jgi:hypothetical protein
MLLRDRRPEDAGARGEARFRRDRPEGEERLAQVHVVVKASLVRDADEARQVERELRLPGEVRRGHAQPRSVFAARAAPAQLAEVALEPSAFAADHARPQVEVGIERGGAEDVVLRESMARPKHAGPERQDRIGEFHDFPAHGQAIAGYGEQIGKRKCDSIKMEEPTLDGRQSC